MRRRLKSATILAQPVQHSRQIAKIRVRGPRDLVSIAQVLSDDGIMFGPTYYIHGISTQVAAWGNERVELRVGEGAYIIDYWERGMLSSRDVNGDATLMRARFFQQARNCAAYAGQGPWVGMSSFPRMTDGMTPDEIHAFYERFSRRVPPISSASVLAVPEKPSGVQTVVEVSGDTGLVNIAMELSNSGIEFSGAYSIPEVSPVPGREGGEYCLILYRDDDVYSVEHIDRGHSNGIVAQATDLALIQRFYLQRVRRLHQTHYLPPPQFAPIPSITSGLSREQTREIYRRLGVRR